jgi:hypothetical protein
MGFIEYLVHAILMTITVFSWSFIMICLLIWGVGVLLLGNYSTKEEKKENKI